MGVQSKHFVNAPVSLVIQSLQGLCTINPNVSLDVADKVVHLIDHDKSKVAIICGGGSGHEPAHAGFVGYGMLTAAVCGNIFASPGPNQVKRGIELAGNDAGTLIIVKNYTGDVLNFGLAKEQHAAAHPEKADRVKFLVVGDDVAVGKSQGSIVGRRGLAGTVIVYKIAGAFAQTGASLEEVYKVSEWVSNRLATVGAGLDHCHVPDTATGESHLQGSEVEIGMGIHNEPGTTRVSPVPPLNELIEQLLDLLLSQSDTERSFLPVTGDNDEVVLMVNNLGGVSELELAGVVREVEKNLSRRHVGVQRVLSGTYMASLNMPGFSITLLLLPSKGDSDAPPADFLLRLLDAPTSAPGWKWSSGKPPSRKSSQPASHESPASSVLGEKATRLSAAEPSDFVDAIRRACQAVDQEEPEITRMDTIAGDGDCGLTLQTGARAVLENIRSQKISGDDVVGCMIALSSIAADKMGGTSGAIYSIFFSALAQGLQSAAGSNKSATNEIWAQAVSSALAKLYTYTRARPPSRTIVDPLDAFTRALAHTPRDVRAAVGKAAAAAEQTRDVEAKAGRSAYVEGDLLKRERVPDPGAWGVKVVLEALLGN